MDNLSLENKSDERYQTNDYFVTLKHEIILLVKVENIFFK